MVKVYTEDKIEFETARGHFGRFIVNYALLLNDQFMRKMRLIHTIFHHSKLNTIYRGYGASFRK